MNVNINKTISPKMNNFAMKMSIFLPSYKLFYYKSF